MDLLSADSTRWSELKEKSRSGEWDVYEKVPPGQAITRKRHVVCIDNTLTDKVADRDVKKLAAQEQLTEEESLQMLVGDLVHLTDRTFVKALNKHLDECGSSEGCFYFMSEAAGRLAHLQKKGKINKASKFQEHLDSFAAKYNIAANVLSQWPAVMDCRDVRDRLAHSARYNGIQSLQQALSDGVPVLEPCKDAVAAMIVIGQRFQIV